LYLYVLPAVGIVFVPNLKPLVALLSTKVCSFALSDPTGVNITRGVLPKAVANSTLTISPVSVLAPATIVIVPLVSLPSILTTGAGMLLVMSSVPAAVPIVVVGVLPAVIM
jgi:hypothetical protein